MHLPRPLYEAVPLIYIAGGLVSMLLIEAPFSVISACLFACASWMVWRMRKDNRSRRHMRAYRTDADNSD
jgi:hypothetical protein